MTGTDSKVEKSRIRNWNHPNPKTYSKTYSGADSRPESLTALEYTGRDRPVRVRVRPLPSPQSFFTWNEINLPSTRK